jgi:hypothetical protein
MIVFQHCHNLPKQVCTVHDTPHFIAKPCFIPTSSIEMLSMNTSAILVAAIWGAIAGLLAIHTLANLLAMGFCVHGLLMTRWKRLAKKATLGTVKYDINLQLLLKVSFYALLLGGLLHYGDTLVRSEFRFRYTGNAQLLFAVLATLAAFSRLNVLRKRSQMIWRMSHVPDYAERRKRTRLLKH